MFVRSWGLLAGLIFVSSLRMSAVTVVNTTAGTSLGAGATGGRTGTQTSGVVEVASWTQASAYSNVTIAAALATTDLGFNSITAYLTTKTGPGTTSADLVASATVTIPGAGTGLPVLTTLFSNLTLTPGTYYLMISGDSSQTQFVQSWYYFDSSTPVVASGVTLGSDQFADGLLHPGTVSVYIPASTLTNRSGRNVYTVTGDLIQPPQITKSFGALELPLGATTSLSFGITNPNPTTALENVSFADTLPLGLPVASPTGAIVTCASGTFTAPANATSISLAGVTLPANGTCTFTLNVSAVTAGYKTNSVQVKSTTSGPGNTATAALFVVAPPNLGTSFGVGAVNVNGVTSLTFTLINPNLQSSLTGVGFIDSLPSGLEVASPNAISNSCGGTLSATAGSTNIILNAVTMAPSALCKISINVKGTTPGPKDNNVQPNSANGGAGTASLATLNVAGPPQLTKSFSKAFISVGGVATLTYSVTNPNTVPMTGVVLSDSLPSGLVVASPNGLAVSGCGTKIVVSAAGGAINVGNATVISGTPCVVSLSIMGTTEGMKVLANSPISADNAPSAGAFSIAGGPNILVIRPPAVSKAFGVVSIPLATSTTLTFTVSNPGTQLLTGVSFTDTLPAGLVVSTPNGLTGTCTSTVTATAGGSTITFAALDIPAQSSCTFTVNVTSQAVGQFLNTTSAITSTNSDPGDPASATLSSGSQFQVRYAGNLATADAVINLTNTGTNTIGAGTLCANVYVFSPDEQLVACCACPITPNGLASVSAKQDLVNNTLTAAAPGAVVIKLLATLPGAGTTCSPTTPTAGTLAPGLSAWGTTTHLLPDPRVTETPFTDATLSVSELSRITALCGFIQANGSGFGICSSCRSGSLGGSTRK